MQPVFAEGRIGNSNVDTDRVAALLLRWYGQQAATRARLRAQDLKKSDDMSGCVLWLTIEGAIHRRTLATADLATLSTAA